MLAAILDKVSLGTPSAYRNLTLTPILLKDGPLSSLEPMSLEEALGAGTLRVSEVSAEGHVPELRVDNSGDAPVLSQRLKLCSVPWTLTFPLWLVIRWAN
jgi:hypothetical protein